MMDFGGNELYMQSIVAQRNREARAAWRVAEAMEPPRGLRATLATRLAHLAVHLDRETTDRLVVRHLRAAGDHR
jgi:hypothetical protein